jgi:hypothetical protein
MPKAILVQVGLKMLFYLTHDAPRPKNGPHPTLFPLTYKVPNTKVLYIY